MDAPPGGEPLARRLRRACRKLQVYRHNPVRDLRLWWDLRVRKAPVADLFPYERRVRSQHGEDGVLEAIFLAIGTTNRYFVEFGAGTGAECNTALLRERGWSGLWMDGREQPPGSLVRRERITAENINALFSKHSVPDEFDVLSIDLDGVDYWIWKALESRWRPRVVLAEYNANFLPPESVTVPYDPSFQWDASSDYYGASLSALEKLAARKGCALVYCESSGVNAFFVRSDCAEGRFLRRPAAELYREPVFGKKAYGHPPDRTRERVHV